MWGRVSDLRRQDKRLLEGEDEGAERVRRWRRLAKGARTVGAQLALGRWDMATVGEG